MESNKNHALDLEDVRVNVKTKLSSLWVATMFVYVYVDIFGFYKPGTVEDILVGKVWEFDISQTWALSAIGLMMVPTSMIFLSLVLRSKINRWANVVVGLFFVVVSAVNPIGESWAFIWVGSGIEIVFLSLIVWMAWNWPKSTS